MPPIEWVFVMIIAACAVLALYASSRVFNEHEGLGRSAAQLAFVWLLPVIGPLVTIHLLRQNPTPGSGMYSNTFAAEETGDWLRQGDAIESHSSGGGDGSGEGGH